MATVVITDRNRLLAFLTGDDDAGAAHAKRPRLAGVAGVSQPAARGDGLLPEPEDVTLSTCAQLHDRNSILLSQHKVREPARFMLRRTPPARSRRPPRACARISTACWNCCRVR